MDKIKTIIPELRAILRTVLLLLAVTTWLTAALMLWNFFAAWLPVWAAIPLTGLASFLTAKAIDGLLDALLPVAASPYSLTSRRERAFVVIIRVFSFVLLLVSGTLSWWAMPEISRTAIQEPDDKEILRTVQDVNASVARTIADKNAELADANRTVTKAEADGKKLVQDAINSHPEAARLLRSGNTWVKTAPQLSAWRAKVARAETKAEKMKEDAEKYVRTLHNERGAAVTEKTNAADSVNMALVGIAAKKQARYDARMTRFTNVLYLFDLGWMGIALVVAILLFLVNGHEVRERKSGIGLMFRTVEERTEQFLGWLETVLLPSGPGRKTDAKKDRTDASDLGSFYRPAPDVMPVPIRDNQDGRDFASVLSVLSDIQQKVSVQSGPVVIEKEVIREVPAAGTLAKRCLYCGTDFTATRTTARFCSPNCRKRHHEKTLKV